MHSWLLIKKKSMSKKQKSYPIVTFGQFERSRNVLVTNIIKFSTALKLTE